MKSLVKRIAKSDFSILVRNSLRIKSVNLKPTNLNHPTTISDAFLWRTDNGFKTKFKYSDILNLFYGLKNSWVEIHFFTKNNIFLKKLKYSDLKISNEIEITSDFFNGLIDFGVFYIYHLTKDKIKNNNIISNRCYLGYSKDEQLYSFVHGNTLARYSAINSSKNIYTNIVTTSLIQNQEYTIQKYFSGFEKNELFFSNPTNKTIKFSIGSKHYKLKAGETKNIDINEPLITIKSNCLFLRPTVFSYKNNFYDVHHS